MTDFTDLLFDNQPNNPSGVETELFFAPLEDFDTIEKTIDPPVALGDELRITGTHTFQVGKGFRKLYITMDTGEVRDEAVGEIDGKSFEHFLDGRYPGREPAALATFSKMNNAKMIFLVREACGSLRQLGSEKFPAKMETLNITSGKETSSANGITFTIKSKGLTPAPIYEGTITLQP